MKTSLKNIKFPEKLLFVSLWALLQLWVLAVTAQDAEQVKTYTRELSRDYYCGRGYENQGDHKAATWIATQFEEAGIHQIDDNWFQEFQFSINTMPSTLELKIDDVPLKTGTDFILRKSFETTNRTYDILHVTNDVYSSKEFTDSVTQLDLSNTIAIVDINFIYGNYKNYTEVMDQLLSLSFPAWVYLTDQPLRSYAMYGRKVRDVVMIEMSKEIITGKEKKLSLNVETEFLSDYTSKNVVGYVRGTKKPEEYVILGAHYDHLGMMGKATYFPGADDNASGVAAVIEFARFFSDRKNRPECSVIFVCFGAEEAGLIGSEHFVNHCPVPPESIKLVINLDMIAYGESGFMVEHGDVLTDYMNTLREIIKSNNLDIEIYEAEAQPHSDHFPFIEKDIPAFFITSGVKDSKDYHTVNDTFESLPFTKINELLILLREFIYTF